ncbi:MAG: hypothetical protein LBH26_08130 [Treponema sp.]|jgi:hypothetical protein|nr:hypothetical protein [Treponema sp.]
MKNFARLALFFSLNFAALFFFATIVRYLQIRIDALRSLPPGLDQPLENLFFAIRWALPVTIYTSLLFGLSYSVRRQIFAPLSVLSLIVLTTALSFAVFTFSEHLIRIPGLVKPVKNLGKPGLILRRGDNAMVLLGDPADTGASRVVSLPGSPLIFQEIPPETGGSTLNLPSVPFRTGTAWFLQSLIIDFSLTGWQLAACFAEGPLFFLVYTAALVFLLASLRFILGLGSWPLANLFLGALVFRGILILETFLNSGEIRRFLADFVGDLIPPSFMSPLVFCFLGFLVCLYSGLNFLAVRKNDEDF